MTNAPATGSEETNPIGAIGDKWWLLLVLGLITVASGILAINHPVTAVRSVSIIFGIWLIFSGIGSIARGFGDNAGGGKVLLLISGILSLTLGIMFFREDIISQAIWVSFFIGISFLFRGIAELAAGFAAKGQDGRGWLIFMGIITILAGVVMLSNPIASIITWVRLISFFLLVIGFMEIFSSFKVRKLSK